MSTNFTQDFRTQRRNYDDGLTRVGEIGRLWYESETGTIRISDGVTAGGVIVAGGGGGGPGGSLVVGDNVSLLTNDASYISFTNLTAAGDLVYNNITGEFSVTTYKSTDFSADLAATNTDSLDEGTVNLYFTDGRVDARVANTSISSLLDVDSDLIVNLNEDSILIYNATNNEFVAESFLAILNRLKAELEVQYDRLVDEAGTFTYIGEADPGTDRTVALWRIKRISEAPDGDLDIIWANGTAAFDKVWNSRATYAYV